RMGFAPREVGLVATLVRRHLLLPETATTRDLRDPATLRSVASRVGDRETLALLAALTRADARATSEKAWSSWRAGLVTELVRRCEQLLDGRPPAVPRPPDLPVPDAVRRDRSACEVEVDRAPGGATVRAWSGDRIGLLADVAAALALERLPVRAARAWTRDRLGVSEWTVESEQPDAAALRRRLTAVADGRIDVRARLAGSQPDRLEPAVVVHRGASADATAIEVRTQDRPDLVHLVLRTLAGLGLSVRSAHVRAVGPQAVGVVYVQDGGGLLAPERADAAAHALEAVLRAR
ncbi:MAG: [protein-PII] uridylyltransferase, partial [Marmoricola sp.]